MFLTQKLPAIVPTFCVFEAFLARREQSNTRSLDDNFFGSDFGFGESMLLSSFVLALRCFFKRCKFVCLCVCACVVCAVLVHDQQAFASDGGDVDEKDVLVLTKDNFDATVNGEPLMLVEFYGNVCARAERAVSTERFSFLDSFFFCSAVVRTLQAPHARVRKGGDRVDEGGSANQIGQGAFDLRERASARCSSHVARRRCVVRG